MSATPINSTKPPRDEPVLIIIIPVVTVILLIITCIITILLVLYCKKSRKEYSLKKTDPARNVTKTEGTIKESPHSVYSTIRNEDHIYDENQGDTECIYDAVKEVSNPKKQDFSQVYDEVNIELVNRLQNRSSPHNEAIEVERAQLYSFVGTSNKKEIRHGNENMANYPEHQSDFGVYAEVGNDVIVLSHEFDGEVNEYAVVDNTPKKMNQEENYEVHANKTIENNRISVEPDSSHIYSVVDKNRTYSSSSGSVGSSI